MESSWKNYIEILRREVVPALGCTEPIAVALASAQSAALLGERPRRLTVRVSGNLFKNGMGVGVPGTGMTGLPIAAAIGAVAGDPDAGLEVLRHVGDDDVAAARLLLPSTRVGIQETSDPIYADVRARSRTGSARVVIAREHTRVVLRERNGALLFRDETAAPATAAPPPDMTVGRLFDFATTVPLDRIAFMERAARLNEALSDEGFRGTYGLRIGATLLDQVRHGILADDLLTLAMRLSSAASDARMDGAMLPAMANSGSGNQGIAATMPVVAAARLLNADRERLIRAVTLSHILAIHIKAHLLSLSALCAASTAAMGAGAAITWLLGGGRDDVAACIHNMVGDVSGIICDGAKTSCSMKVATATAAAVKAALLAKSGIRVGSDQGIVAEGADGTIANLGTLAREGMRETDRLILRIMMEKTAGGRRDGPAHAAFANPARLPPGPTVPIVSSSRR